MATQVGSIHVVDVIVIIGYFLAVLLVGILSSLSYWREEKKKGAAGGTTAGYFLAGRRMHWLLVGLAAKSGFLINWSHSERKFLSCMVGASLFASNIGSGHFVGLAGSGAAGGVAIAGFELNATFVLIALGWLFVPVYLAANVYTMPEYLQLRFGGRRIQTYLSVLAILLSVFTKISADLYAGTIFIEKSLNLNTYASIVILLVIATLFTVTGGLTAVIWTDAIQVVIMLVGALILMVFSFIEVGGYPALVESYAASLPVVPENVTAVAQCVADAMPRNDSMHMLRAVDADLPWTGMTFGLTISAVWYWCSDQVIVQRALAAVNYTHAKAGCVFAAWLKFLPLFLLVFPGMIARVLYPEDILCYSEANCMAVCGKPRQCTDVAYPTLVIRLLPKGLRGLMLAVMLSALMSSLTSIFNSSSTLFTMDIYKRMRPRAKDAELLWVGRLFVIVLVVISIIWIPVIKGFPNSELFNYIQAVTSYLAPPVCAVYVLAIFVPRVNEHGAFWGLMAGLLVGLTRFALQIGYGAPHCDDVGPDPRPGLLKDVHYLHFGILLFVLCCIVTLVVSLLTKPMQREQLLRLTFWSRYSEQPPALEKTLKSTDAEVPEAKAKGQTKTEQVPLEVKSTEAPTTDPTQTDNDVAEPNARPNLLLAEEESRFWSRFTDVQAVLVCIVCVFFYIYYL